MPVILHPKDFQRWLSRDTKEPGVLDDLIAPYPDDQMEAYPISKQVNSPKNEGAELIKRVDPAPTTLFG
jgi:putative SOS response-associated peptidase YedK